MIPALVGRLLRIAKKNDDEFRFRIDLEPTVRGIRYTFVAEETADGHEFVGASGFTLDSALRDAERNIPGALDSWGYEE